MSALIFILVVEILATIIRNDNRIHGILIGNKEHKVIQFADDITIATRDIESIQIILETVNTFTNCSGLKLNLKKTKGIWLGSLKDLGLRKWCNITWTGRPVKVLGVYIGHNKKLCYELNWQNKLNQIENILQQWSSSNITIFGKVEVIKRYAISKVVFPATVLTVPQDIVKQLKGYIYFSLGKTGQGQKVHNI